MKSENISLAAFRNSVGVVSWLRVLAQEAANWQNANLEKRAVILISINIVRIII